MSDAEMLIDIAEVVLHPREELSLFYSEIKDPEGYGVVISDPSVSAEVIALALRLRARPGMALRALVEDWTRTRIVRELY